MKKVHILVISQHDGRWCWIMQSAERQPLAVSGRTFPTRALAAQDARDTVGHARDAVIDQDAYLLIPQPSHLEHLLPRI